MRKTEMSVPCPVQWGQTSSVHLLQVGCGEISKGKGSVYLILQSTEACHGYGVNVILLNCSLTRLLWHFLWL